MMQLGTPRHGDTPAAARQRSKVDACGPGRMHSHGWNPALGTPGPRVSFGAGIVLRRAPPYLGAECVGSPPAGGRRRIKSKGMYGAAVLVALPVDAPRHVSSAPTR